MTVSWIKVVLTLSGIYDGVIGLIFLLVPATLFRTAGITPPNHFGYVQFPALLLIIFGIMFLRAASDPVGRRETLIYGMALKASYAGLVFWYQLHGGVPILWVPFAWADTAFFILFFFGWKKVSRR
ncbi:MAG TPA: hypothetical protein VFU86_03450 [Terriglobales bacterium]|nr:hypothetical protein [Terriglobales bacterium]